MFPQPPAPGAATPGGPVTDGAPLVAQILASFGQAPAIGRSDPYKNRQAMLELMKRCKEESFDERWAFERTWWRSILYTLGRQWIYYDGAGNQWKDKRMAKWIPRPVTNKVAETNDTIMSVFQGVQLGVTCVPIAPNPDDEATAQTQNLIAPALHAEHQMDQVFSEHDWWLTQTGNAILHPWWDGRQEKSFVLVPFERCLQCDTVSHPKDIQACGHKCPSCGCPALKEAMGPDGQPITEKVSVGQGRTDVLSPFEIAVPSAYGDLATQPYIIRKRWRAKLWYQKNAPDVAARIPWEKTSTDRSLQLLRGISTQTDIGPAPAAYTSGSQKEEGVTEYELWYKPTKDYPEGLILRTIEAGSNLEIVDFADEGVPGPLPNKTPKGDYLMPFVHTRYERVGGRLWGRSPLDRIIQKQDQINQVDSLIQLIIQRTANPIWIHPKGAMVRRFSGEPGLVMEYTTSGAQNNKPEKIAGSEVPGSLFRIREGYLQDFEQLAGTYDITKGQKPAGVEAFSALQLLVERSQSRFGMVLAERGRTYRDWFELAIEMERQFGPEDRIWQVLGPNNQWTFQNFQHAQLTGNVRIMVEDGSQTPKTSLGKRAAIQQLVELQVISPTLPDTAYRIAKIFGQTDLLPGLDASVSAALVEQDAFEKWAVTAEMLPGAPAAPMVGPASGQVIAGQPAPPTLNSAPPGKRRYWDDDTVHIAEHKKWANSDKVRKIITEKPYLEAIVAWMIQQHEMAIQQAQMQAAMAAAPPGPGGAGMAMSNSNSESGDAANANFQGQ